MAVKRIEQRRTTERPNQHTCLQESQRRIAEAGSPQKAYQKGREIQIHSLLIPLSSICSIPGICMAPMNIMAQNTIDEFGHIILNDHLTQDQSWKWSMGTLVNSQVKKELLQALRYGFCIRRIINWALVARQKCPGQRILASKIDYKLAYCQGMLHFATALCTASQLPDNNLSIITLKLTSVLSNGE